MLYRMNPHSTRCEIDIKDITSTSCREQWAILDAEGFDEEQENVQIDKHQQPTQDHKIQIEEPIQKVSSTQNVSILEIKPST